MRIEIAALREGELPPRPAALVRPNVAGMAGNGEIADAVVRGGRIAVVGGVSLEGAEGRLVPLVTAVAASPDGAGARGWTVAAGDDGPELIHFDTASAPLGHNPFPNLMLYFAGELADEVLLAPDAPEADIAAIARFVSVFLSDDGAPNGIDW